MSWRALFGGAIQAEIPASFLDASLVREVPDHQEVFVDKDTDQSIIVELLEMADVPAADASKYHFDELAVANEAIGTSEILLQDPIIQGGTDGVLLLPSDATVNVLVGRQKLQKFRSQRASIDSVLFLLATLRLPSVGTDLLVTFHVPEIGDGMDGDVLERFKRLVSSLEVLDWSLFA